MPGSQVVPFQQPVQQTPPLQVPPAQEGSVPSGTLAVPQAPVSQVAVLHAGGAGQVVQVPPAGPQWAVVFPG